MAVPQERMSPARCTIEGFSRDSTRGIAGLRGLHDSRLTARSTLRTLDPTSGGGLAFPDLLSRRNLRLLRPATGRGLAAARAL